ncbi:spermidine/putrescine import ATP-binding protein PotA [Spirochaetia bacterium]|nr:spermidine/putrescine import ATP-binding protein PotA [Spirochaetia bacterium]
MNEQETAQEVLRLEGIEKSFTSDQGRRTPVLRGINLSVHAGEFITLLGASGCGKTTTLRIIAGLEKADAGRVFLAGEDVGNLAPDKRDVNMVFQNYALFPHMNVAANIGYSLRLKRRPKADIQGIVGEALEMVQLAGFEGRLPAELSGGQRQRVAVARALVNRPKVLLLDEPLGALDLQLRRQMQLELKRLQKQLGITFIYITHDQEEALTMSDRIAVMRDGRFEQAGSAPEVYDRPKTSYVAQFVGSANILKGTVASGTAGAEREILVLEHPAGRVRVQNRGKPIEPGEKLTVAVRSEYLVLEPWSKNEGEGLEARITEKSFAGGQLRITAVLAGGEEAVKETGVRETLVASRHGIDSPLEAGAPVRVNWTDPAQAVIVDREEGFSSDNCSVL